MNYIALCSDNNYVPHASALIASVAENNYNGSFSFFVLCNNVNLENIKILKAQANNYNNVKISIIDSSSIKEWLGIKVPSTIAISAYIRLFLADLLPKDVDKILYLDCDIVVCNSLAELFQTNIDDFYVAGCYDIDTIFSKSKIDLPAEEPYLNSGVLYINLKKWRDENCTSKFIEYLKNRDGTVYHHDQGIINKICKGEKKIMHPKYNVLTAYYDFKFKELKKSSFPFYSQSEILNAKESPVILHFTPSLSNRPWIKNSNHPFKSKYLSFKSKTHWANHPLNPDRRPLYLKALAFIYFKISPKLYYLILSLRKTLRK